MNTKNLAFVGATAITPFEEIVNSAVVFDQDQIIYVGPCQRYPIDEKVETVNIQGKFITPGFIDMHIHGGAGSDFMDATRQDFETICRYHAQGGTTALLATTATAPLDDIKSTLQRVREVQKDP